MTSLTKRILVAAIGIPLAIALFWLGGIPLALAIALISALATLELYNIAQLKAYPTFKTLGIIFGALPIVYFQALPIVIKDTLPLSMLWVVLIGIAFVLVPIALVCYLFSNRPNSLAGIAITLLGLAYITLPFLCLVALRALEPSGNANFGRNLLFLVFGSIWICDSAAFFFGRAFGKHKLMPSVSPNKSVEGAVAGFITATAFFIGVSQAIIPSCSILFSVVCGCVIASLGQIGDLVESKIKRDVGVKDSGSLIPGHGGLLDRFDSIIMVAPIVLLLAIIFHW